MKTSRINLLSLAIALASLLISVTALAGSSLGEYLEGKKVSPEYAQAYIRGVGEGISSANAMVENFEKRAPSFCPPPVLIYTDRDYDALLVQFANSSPQIDSLKTSVPALLFLAMKKRFPCDTRRPNTPG